MNKKYNKLQGLMVKYGINPLGIYSVPVSELIEKLEPYRLENPQFRTNIRFPQAWQMEFANSKYYTDRNFSFSYDYDKYTNSDVYRLSIEGEDHYFSHKLSAPSFRVGESIDVEKINTIQASSYKINFTIKISMLRGYVNLSVLDLLSGDVTFEEKEVYFKSITKQGLEKEIQKFVFNRLGY